MSMQEGWHAEAAAWAQFARGGQDRSHAGINLPAFLELLPPPGQRALDLGCGEGRMGRLLRPRGYRVTGVDASPAMVRLAVTHQSPEPAVVGDAARLPFRDGSFDLVVAYMCLHDIDATPAAVGEIARVLAPWGRLCAAVPHPVSSAGSFQGDDEAAPFVIPGSLGAAVAAHSAVPAPAGGQAGPAVNRGTARQRVLRSVSCRSARASAVYCGGGHGCWGITGYQALAVSSTSGTAGTRATPAWTGRHRTS
jgi:SAM-dependent methyltransferase